MDEDLLNRISELEDEVEGLKKEKKTMAEDMESRLLAVEKVLREHTHRGDDDSASIEKDIELLSGQKFVSGDVATFAGLESAVNNRTLFVASTGRDKSEAEGINNSQVQLEHQYFTDPPDGTTRQSFFYGIRGPIYQGTATMASGGTTLTQSNWKWTDDELVGARVLVYNAAATDFEGYEISANTSQGLTITGGTWGFGGTGLAFQVFMPVYLGGATYPWRRIYMEEGTAGGLRIGLGATGGGQNGLLYMDATGDLYWRNKSGTSTKLN